MALTIVRGPAGGGKSGYVERVRRPGEVLADFTLLYAAISGATRGPDGRYPVRLDSDPLIPITAAIKAYIVRQAAARALRGYVTTSDSSAGELARLRELGASDAEAITLDPGRAVVEARLSDPETGELSEQCRLAPARWY